MMLRRILVLGWITAILVLSCTRCVSCTQGEAVDDDDMKPRVAPMIPSECNSALSMISGSNQYSIFNNAIQETGMDSVYGSVRLRATVFIPTDKAVLDTLDSLSIDAETVLKDFDTLHALVRHHVIPYYNMNVADMQVGACYDTMVPGQCIQIMENASLLSGRSNATIDMADLNQGCPTVFHTITGLLTPDFL